MERRSGSTLLEVVVVLAILMILISLLVPAVMKARSTAICTQSKNNLRQIVIAAHSFASANNGALPTNVGNDTVSAGTCFYASLEPYIGSIDYPNSLVVSPADPTVALAAARGSRTIVSYAVNARAFVDNPRMPGTFVDGTSNTIALAEHYAKCGNLVFIDWPWRINPFGPTRRATFADIGDVVPMTSGNPPMSTSDDKQLPNLTFQVAPRIDDCMANFAQTPHSDGMLAAFADGSVHQLSPSIAPHIYWALVTPAGGEEVGDW